MIKIKNKILLATLIGINAIPMLMPNNHIINRILFGYKRMDILEWYDNFFYALWKVSERFGYYVMGWANKYGSTCKSEKYCTFMVWIDRSVFSYKGLFGSLTGFYFITMLIIISLYFYNRKRLTA